MRRQLRGSRTSDELHHGVGRWGSTRSWAGSDEARSSRLRRGRPRGLDQPEPTAAKRDLRPSRFRNPGTYWPQRRGSATRVPKTRNLLRGRSLFALVGSGRAEPARSNPWFRGVAFRARPQPETKRVRLRTAHRPPTQANTPHDLPLPPKPHRPRLVHACPGRRETADLSACARKPTAAGTYARGRQPPPQPSRSAPESAHASLAS